MTSGSSVGFLGMHLGWHLEVEHLDTALDAVLSNTLDDLARFEDITTGVIITPNSRYYPVSIERFIASILEDEFSV